MPSKNNTPKTTIYDLIRESVLSQLLLTLIVFTGTFVTYIVRGEVPEFMTYMCLLIAGFFFGAKVTNQLSKGVTNGGYFADSRPPTDPARSIGHD